MEEDYTFQNPNPHLHSRSHLLVKLWKEIFKFTSSFFFFFSFINQALDSCNITSFKRSMTTSQVFPACCFTCSLGRNYLVLVRVLWIESRESKDRFSTERNRFNVQIPPPPPGNICLEFYLSIYSASWMWHLVWYVQYFQINLIKYRFIYLSSHKKLAIFI